MRPWSCYDPLGPRGKKSSSRPWLARGRIASPYSWPTWLLPNEFEGFYGEPRLSALFPFGARSIGTTLSGSDLRNTRGLMLTGLARGIFASPATGAFMPAGLGTED